MDIKTVVKETIRQLDRQRNFMRLHFALTPELRKFYREQCLNYLLLCEQSIIDYMQKEHCKQTIAGELEYIQSCIRV